MYLPSLLDPASLVVVTEKQIRVLTQADSTLTSVPNETVLLADNARRNPSMSGRRLLVWDDADGNESSNSWHYALVFRRNSGDNWSSLQLQQLQADLNLAIVQQRLSPVWLTGSMTASGYPTDSAL
jgi:endoglycosylceramidase